MIDSANYLYMVFNIFVFHPKEPKLWLDIIKFELLFKTTKIGEELTAIISQSIELQTNDPIYIQTKETTGTKLRNKITFFFVLIMSYFEYTQLKP